MTSVQPRLLWVIASFPSRDINLAAALGVLCWRLPPLTLHKYSSQYGTCKNIASNKTSGKGYFIAEYALLVLSHIESRGPLDILPLFYSWGPENTIFEPIPVAGRSKAWACDRSLAGIAGSNPIGGMNVCVVCCKDKGTSQDNQNKEASTEEVERENKSRNSKKRV